MSRAPELTTTTYAILGLLTLRPWTTYELAQQMGRSFRYFWPRAESKLYEEPKKLVRHGLAVATKDSVGRRKRTIYTITPKGRRSLRRWLAEDGAGPQLEFELLLKVFFAEHADKATALGNVRAIDDWATTMNDTNIAFAREYLQTGGPFPERLAQIVLVGRFLTDFGDMVKRWAEWADGVIASWPDDPRGVPADYKTLDDIAARATSDECRPRQSLGDDAVAGQ